MRMLNIKRLAMAIDMYMHKQQRRWAVVDAKDSVNICGRRWGKSYLVAKRIRDNVLEMPRSTGVFIASSFRQAHSRTLPSALMALEQMGLRRDIHYVIGKRPDKRLGFAEPYFLPTDLHDVVWFCNGTIMIIVSQEVPMGSNSLTINWLIGDEAKGLSYEKLSNELFPAMGGTSVHFNDVVKYPHLWGFHFFTDMPVNKEGLWLINRYEKFKDDELYNLIIRDAIRLDELEAQPVNTYNKREISILRRQLSYLRNKCLYFTIRPSIDNIDIIGAEYFHRMERELTPEVFKAEILCQRITDTKGKFYANFSQSNHTYTATDNSKLNDYRQQAYDCRLDTDLQTDKPIAVSFDYNAQITWLVAAQVQGHIHKTLKSFFTKYDRRLREVIQDFCEYYRFHKQKTVIYYFDSTALSVNYVEAGHDARYVVHEEFAKYGWTVEDKYLSTPMAHDKKHLLINDAFNGNGKLFPMFNADNNVDLLQAIPLAGTKIGSKGFQKDKSGEKVQETDENLPYELRTDGTDAWDTNFIGCVLLPYDSSFYMFV